MPKINLDKLSENPFTTKSKNVAYFESVAPGELHITYRRTPSSEDHKDTNDYITAYIASLHPEQKGTTKIGIDISFSTQM